MNEHCAESSWFAFWRKGVAGDVICGWGTYAEAEEYLEHLDRHYEIGDETRQHVLERISAADSLEHGLDYLDDAFNIGDELIAIRAEEA